MNILKNFNTIKIPQRKQLTIKIIIHEDTKKYFLEKLESAELLFFNKLLDGKTDFLENFYLTHLPKVKLDGRVKKGTYQITPNIFLTFRSSERHKDQVGEIIYKH
jgi:hypothetical protein